jgi:hypothetical protein
MIRAQLDIYLIDRLPDLIDFDPRHGAYPNKCSLINVKACCHRDPAKLQSVY